MKIKDAKVVRSSAAFIEKESRVHNLYIYQFLVRCMPIIGRESEHIKKRNA